MPAGMRTAATLPRWVLRVNSGLRKSTDVFLRVKPAAGRWLNALASLRGVYLAARSYPSFVCSWRSYARMDGAEPIRFRDSYPCLDDRTTTTPYDPHYFHQAVWATEQILRAVPEEHVDVGSEITFVGMISAIVPVAFVDIRPLMVQLPRLRSVEGDLLALPFDNRSVASLSCLHVAEHVGLGRYGRADAGRDAARLCGVGARPCPGRHPALLGADRSTAPLLQRASRSFAGTDRRLLR